MIPLLPKEKQIQRNKSTFTRNEPIVPLMDIPLTEKKRTACNCTQTYSSSASSGYLFYKKWGLYGETLPNHWSKYVFFGISSTCYLFAIAFCIWSFEDNRLRHNSKLCLPFELCFIFLQFQSFAIYILGFMALQNIDSSHIKTLYKPSAIIHMILIIQITLPFVSGFLTLYDDEIWKLMDKQGVGKGMEIASYVVDLIRYWQAVCIVIVLHAALNSFTQQKMQHFHSSVVDVVNTNTDLWTNRLDEPLLSVVPKLDHNTFITEFNEMIFKYRGLLYEFRIFIAVNAICVCISWLLMVWWLIWEFTENNPCHSYAYWYHIHYGLEVLFFCDMLLLIIWRLTRNHSLIIKYRNMLCTKTVLQQKRRSYKMIAERSAILNYLNVVIECESPFRVCGVTPTMTKLFWITSSVMCPFMWQIYQLSTSKA